MGNIVPIGRKGGKAGGGSASSTVSEAANTLQTRSTARIIEVISHGECVGLADRVNPQKSVKLDGVPVQNQDGSFNYSGLVIQERVGLPDQDPFTGFAEVETEVAVNQTVTVPFPRLYSVTANNVKAVRVTIQVDSLTEQDEKSGGIKGSSVSYVIDRRVAAGAFETVLTETLNDKCTSSQSLSYRIERPAAADDFTDWEVRVTRLTADSISLLVQNSFRLLSVTELVDSNLQYADMAAVAHLIDARQFGSSIPVRSYDFVGMILDVPSNYTPPNYNDPLNPAQRSYSGLWDGTFKRAWTDNPAWILWAMLTNKEWGLGKVIDASNVDKWALYQIAQYCDEFIPDGTGGVEPRYRVNTQITSAEEAYAMLHSIASTFRGMLYWGSGTVTFVADQPRDAVKLVTPANIIGGDFTYQGSARKARHSVVRVTWNDPSDGYKNAIEVVEDPEMISLYGWRPTDVIAYGCTSRGQANRLGRWIIDTERYESEIVTYNASFDHADVRPGDIIQVHDQYYAGKRMGGRLAFVAPTNATVDSAIEIESGQTYVLSMLRPDGVIVEKTITNGPTTAAANLTWSGSLSALPAGTAVIFSDALLYSTQRSTALATSGTGATLLDEVTLEANVTYDLCFTDTLGAIQTKTLPVQGSTISTRLLTWSGSINIPEQSIIFIIPHGEGYASRSISASSPLSCNINSSFTFLEGQTYVVEFDLLGTKVQRKLTNAVGSSTVLHWSDPINDIPEVGSMWGLTASNLAPRLFRVMSVNEVSANNFQVQALTYDPNKYDRIELGLVIPGDPTSTLLISTPPEPASNLRAYLRPVLQANNTFIEHVVAFWDPSPSGFVARYRVSYQFQNEPWITLNDVTSPSVEFLSSGIGEYTFNVVAISYAGKESRALIVKLAVTDERPLAESIIQNIRIKGTPDVTQSSNVEFVGRDLSIEWTLKPPPDWVDPDPEHWEDPYFRRYVVRIVPPTGSTASPYGVYYTTEPNFTFSFDQNVEAGGPYRDFRVGVSLEDTTGHTYTEVLQEFSNDPPPITLVVATIEADSSTINFKFDEPNISDYAGIIVWLSENSTVPLDDAHKVWMGRGMPRIPARENRNYWFRYAFYDTFGTSGIDVSGILSVLTTELEIDGHPASYWTDQIANLGSIEIEQIKTDTIANAYSLLELAMRNVEDRGYTEDLTYDAGTPLKTVVKNGLLVQDDLVEAMDLIGVVSGDGNSFILNVNTVKISPTESIATRFSEIQSNFTLLGHSTGTSWILDLDTTKVSGTESLATRLTSIQSTFDLLGDVSGSAFILDLASTHVSGSESLGTRLTSITANFSALGSLSGSAWILNSSNVLVNGSQSLATVLTSLTVSQGSFQGQLTALAQVDAAYGAKWGISTNVNGHITGILLLNNGSSGNFIVQADTFGVINSSGTVAVTPFVVTGGVVKMTNVVASNIDVNVITANQIIGGAVTTVTWSEQSAGSASIGTGAVQYFAMSHSTTFGGAAHVISVNVLCSHTGGSNAGILVTVKRNGTSIGTRSFLLIQSFSYTGSFTFFDQPPSSGSNTYTIELNTTAGSDANAHAELLNMIVTELKR